MSMVPRAGSDAATRWRRSRPSSNCEGPSATQEAETEKKYDLTPYFPGYPHVPGGRVARGPAAAPRAPGDRGRATGPTSEVDLAITAPAGSRLDIARAPWAAPRALREPADAAV